MSNLSFSQLQSLGKIYDIFTNLINLKSFTDAQRQLLVHPLADIMWSCELNGQPCSASDFSWRWDPLYGNCYSYNSGLNSSGSTMSFKESLLPGAQFGLKLDIYVGYNDYLKTFNVGWLQDTYGANINTYGLNILIQNNTYLTQDRFTVIALQGGTSNYIGVQRKFTTKLPKPYSNCDIDNKNPGYIDSEYYNLIKNSPYQYNQELCVLQCLQKTMIETCNCTFSIFLSLYNASCKSFAEGLCGWHAILPGGGYNIDSHMENCILQCPLECNKTQFTFTLTSQKYTGPLFEALVKSNPVYSSDFTITPITEETASNKFVEAIIYYDSLTFTSSEDSPSMDIVSLLGNIGGTLGLLLGLSVLTLCESIHVFIETMILLKKKILF